MLISLIEDDEALREGMTLALEDAGHRVLAGETVADALRHGNQIDALITDVCLNESDTAGLTIVGSVKQRWPGVEVVVMTGRGSVPQAVEAMRLGARTYLQKPFPTAQLLSLLREIDHLTGLRQGMSGRGALVGSSRVMRRVYAQIDIAAGCDLPVLIRGDTGTGKELAARAIHDLSSRRDRPFIALNCSAIPRELADSELFGHEAGSFTGATARRQGCFAAAHGGTLFLDEIDSLPLDVQPKLLRVLESGEFSPVGTSTPTHCDVRVVAATNADIERMLDGRRFRDDLYFRLDGLPVGMPPLREHPEDIPAIASIILERRPVGARPCSLAMDAMAALIGHQWPGNVRELVHLVRRSAAVAAADQPGRGPVIIGAVHLGLPGALPELPFKEAQEQATDAWTRRTIQAALAQSGGSLSKAAELLRMHRCAIYKLVRRLAIPLAQPDERDQR